MSDAPPSVISCTLLLLWWQRFEIAADTSMALGERAGVVGHGADHGHARDLAFGHACFGHGGHGECGCVVPDASGFEGTSAGQAGSAARPDGLLRLLPPAESPTDADLQRRACPGAASAGDVPRCGSGHRAIPPARFRRESSRAARVDTSKSFVPGLICPDGRVSPFARAGKLARAFCHVAREPNDAGLSRGGCHKESS